MNAHQKRVVCRKIFTSKTLAVDFQSTDLVGYMNIINAIQRWGLRSGKDWAWR